MRLNPRKTAVKLQIPFFNLRRTLLINKRERERGGKREGKRERKREKKRERNYNQRIKLF